MVCIESSSYIRSYVSANKYIAKYLATSWSQNCADIFCSSKLSMRDAFPLRYLLLSMLHNYNFRPCAIRHINNIAIRTY